MGAWCLPAIGQQDHPDHVECPECGHVNEWSNKFCIKCGASLVGAKQEASAKQELVRPLRVPQPATLEAGMSRVFHMRDGNVVSGTIIDIEHDSIAVIESPDGLLRIPNREILEEMVDLVKIDETHFVGPVLSEDDYSISIKTPYGVVVVLKRDILTMDRYYGDKKVSWAEEKKRFLPEEELIDIFLDPTAFPLQPHTIYLSGLSLGYGFTRNFMLRTKFGSDFVGDLNLQPHFCLYNRSTGTSELALAFGAGLYNHHSMKYEAGKYSHWIVDPNTDKRLDEEGAVLVDSVLSDPDRKEFFVTSYLVLSRRQSIASGRGKWGWHIGGMTNSMVLNKPELKEGSVYEWDDNFIPYRVWAAMDYDLTKRLKFLIEVFADNGHKFINVNDTWDSYFDFGGSPFTVEMQSGDYQPVDLDFGFIYSFNEHFRLGMHFQSPYLEIYWKW